MSVISEKRKEQNRVFKDESGPNRSVIDRVVITGSLNSRNNMTFFDPYRQGVYLRDAKDRFLGSGLKISEGSINHEITTHTFGQPVLNDSERSFQDLPDILKTSTSGSIAYNGVVSFIESEDFLIDLYPQLRFVNSQLDPDTFDGVIEPMTIIRNELTNRSNSGPFEKGGIKGSLAGGDDINSFYGTSLIEDHSVASEDFGIKDFFEDAQDVAFQEGDYTLSFPGFVSEVERKLKPFSDDLIYEKNMETNLLNVVSSSGEASVLLRLKSNREKVPDEDNKRYTSSGFTHYTANTTYFSQNRESIAYSGLIRG